MEKKKNRRFLKGTHLANFCWTSGTLSSGFGVTQMDKIQTLSLRNLQSSRRDRHRSFLQMIYLLKDICYAAGGWNLRLSQTGRLCCLSSGFFKRHGKAWLFMDDSSELIPSALQSYSDLFTFYNFIGAVQLESPDIFKIFCKQKSFTFFSDYKDNTQNTTTH